MIETPRRVMKGQLGGDLVAELTTVKAEETFVDANRRRELVEILAFDIDESAIGSELPHTSSRPPQRPITKTDRPSTSGLASTSSGGSSGDLADDRSRRDRRRSQNTPQQKLARENKQHVPAPPVQIDVVCRISAMQFHPSANGREYMSSGACGTCTLCRELSLPSRNASVESTSSARTSVGIEDTNVRGSHRDIHRNCNVVPTELSTSESTHPGIVASRTQGVIENTSAAATGVAGSSAIQRRRFGARRLNETRAANNTGPEERQRVERGNNNSTEPAVSQSNSGIIRQESVTRLRQSTESSTEYSSIAIQFCDAVAERARSVVGGLENIVYDESMQREDDDVCSICLYPRNSGQRITVLPCKHKFHQNCLSDWLDNGSICPLCRKGFGSYFNP